MFYRLAAIALLFLYCDAAPVSVSPIEVESMSKDQKAASDIQECPSNNSSEACSLLLTTISHAIPEEECVMYDLKIYVSTNFSAPAGLREGSTTRIDWEFFPEGNAGFWIAPIENAEGQKEGAVKIAGCFSFQDQEMLRITRTIEDHEGNTSNVLAVDIPKPESKTTSVSKDDAGFQVLFSEVN